MNATHRPTPAPGRESGILQLRRAMAWAILPFLAIATIALAAPKQTTPKKKVSTAPPSARLSVQGETVEASEIWLPHMDDLEQHAKTSSPGELQNYIIQESAQLITDKIAEMLLFQKAKLRLSEPMEKKIDDYVDAELRKRVTAKHGGVQRRMERDLERQGWSLDGYRTHLRRSIVISTYLDDELRPRVPEPTRADLQAAFRDSADSLRKPARRSLSLIDVRLSGFLPAGEEPTPEKRDEARVLARAKITEAQSELRKGTSFADVAKKYSMDSKALDGGVWGFINPESVQDRFAPAFEKLQTLQQGQISEIVEVPDGFFIVKCDRLEPGVDPDFISVQPKLREQLFGRAYNQKISELVNELRKTATIEPEYLEPFHTEVVTWAMRKVVPGTSTP